MDAPWKPRWSFSLPPFKSPSALNNASRVKPRGRAAAGLWWSSSLFGADGGGSGRSLKVFSSTIIQHLLESFDPRQQCELKHGGHRWSWTPAGFQPRLGSVVTRIMSNSCHLQLWKTNRGKGTLVQNACNLLIKEQVRQKIWRSAAGLTYRATFTKQQQTDENIQH